MLFIKQFNLFYKKILPLCFLVLLTSILPISFLDEKTSRILFYFCSYVSLFGLSIEIYKNNFHILMNRWALSLLFLGLMYTSWSLYSLSKVHEGSEFLFTAGKRCILAWLIISYFISIIESFKLVKIHLRYISTFSIATAFLVSSIYAIAQSIASDERIVLGNNRATLTAYAYSALSLALLTIIMDVRNKKILSSLFFIVATVSLYVIFLTQTRSAMAIHIIMVFILIFRLFTIAKNVKVIAAIVVALMLSATSSYKIIETRLDSTFSEISNYQHGDDKTSLGSRFTMWKMGLLSFEHSPLGQTLYERNQYITEYLDSHNQSDSFSLSFIDVHLHNEVIQYASVFGIFGVIVLLYFYWTYIVSTAKYQGCINPLSIMAISTMLYGLTDVLMTSVEYIVVFSTLTTLLTTRHIIKES
jgi:O-antigen ligase